MANKCLILACPRSGTTYTAKLLCGHGLDFTHEQIHGKDGAIGWQYVADGKYSDMAGHRSDRLWDKILHQVRYPLDVIGSMQKHSPQLWDFIASEIDGFPRRDQPIKRRMRFWIEWNRRAEAMASFTYKVEDVGLGGDTDAVLAKILGVTIRDTGQSRTTNKRPHAVITMDDLRRADKGMAKEIEAMSIRYGYNRPPNVKPQG